MVSAFFAFLAAGFLTTHAVGIALSLPGALTLGRGAPRWVAAAFGLAAFACAVAGGAAGGPSVRTFLALAVGLSLGATVAILGASLRPLQPDRVFLPEATETGWTATSVDLEGEPDAQALLLTPRTWAATGGLCVVIGHGGGNDRLYGFWYALPELLARGHAVLTAHQPGHGRGGADFYSLEAARRRMDKMIAFARGLPGCRGVVLLGQSMGAVLVLDAAARGVSVDGVVAVSALTELELGTALLKEVGAFAHKWVYRALRYGTLSDVAPAGGPFKRVQFPVRVAPGGSYLGAFVLACREADLAHRLAAQPRLPPILIVHGSRDGIAPTWEGVAIHESIKERSELLLAPGGHHLDVLFRSDVVHAIGEWIDARAKHAS